MDAGIAAIAVGPVLGAWSVWLVRRRGGPRGAAAVAVFGAIAVTLAFVVARAWIAGAFDDVANLSADQRQAFLSRAIARADGLQVGALAVSALWAIGLAIATVRARRATSPTAP